jgi:hypothetical protein
MIERSCPKCSVLMNRTPLYYYEKYPGSMNNVLKLQYMIKKAQGYGHKKTGFILDREEISIKII